MVPNILRLTLRFWGNLYTPAFRQLYWPILIFNISTDQWQGSCRRDTPCIYLNYQILNNITWSFTFMWLGIVINPYNKINYMHQFSQILFWNETLPVSDESFVHHQEFLTVHTAMVYVVQVCRLLSSSSRIRTELCSNLILLLRESCLQTSMTYTIAVCAVRNSWWWTNELSKTCRVSFPNEI
jgi:hypothetical protein